MQTVVSNFDYQCPEDLDELLAILAQTNSQHLVMAGGTDIIPALKEKEIQPGSLIDIGKIDTLQGISSNGNRIRIGATTTLSDIERSPIIISKAPVLSEAISQMANPQIRNRGTIGGNIVNASPAADTVPALLVLNSQLLLIGPGGTRSLPLSDFFRGYKKTALLPGEILTAIEIPQDSARCVFHKLGKRKAACLSVASAAVALHKTHETCVDVRIALGAVAPFPMRAFEAEAILRGKNIDEELISQAAKTASQECSPVSDVRASQSFRTIMVEVLVRRCLTQITMTNTKES